jgi:hypothetical protein
MANVQWNDERFKQLVGKAAAEGVARCTVLYHTLCQAYVGKSNPRNPKTGEYDQPSKPGEPPRKRIGFGQLNVAMEFDAAKPRGRIGETANAAYMIYLQFGTKFIGPRPWLTLPLDRDKSKLERVALLGMKGKMQ